MAYAEVAGGDIIYASTVNDLILRAINRPGTRLAKQSNQSFANGVLDPITFGSGSEVRDDRGWHSTSSNTARVTPDLPGRYLCIGNVYFAASSVGDRRVYVTKNGSSNGVWGREIANGGNGLTLLVTGVLEANGTGDYFQLEAFQSSGGALNVQGSGDVTFSTTFEVVYFGGPA